VLPGKLEQSRIKESPDSQRKGNRKSEKKKALGNFPLPLYAPKVGVLVVPLYIIYIVHYYLLLSPQLFLPTLRRVAG
jgi:hypothetical protein